KSKKRNSPVPFMRIIFIYMMRIVAGLQFFWHMDSVILRSQSLMRLVGFNGRDIKEGTCNRGRKKPVSDEKKPIQIRGPVSCDFIRDILASIVAPTLEKMFNSGISILAASNFFPKIVHALLDASEIESTEKCKGCGKVTKQKPPELRLRKKRIRKVLETVFGFKIWVVWDPNSRLPLAMRFTTIEVHDINLAQEVVQQAIDNLGDHANITSLAIDRGFMDGIFLWWLNTEGITFFIPAKANMNVYNDALFLAGTGNRNTRDKIRTVGSGKNKIKVTDYWDVEGLEGLTSAEF
ncbi:MAG: transposase, partial [Desulfobacula sp.]|nr:transposase [Desulfobacula sp.]